MEILKRIFGPIWKIWFLIVAISSFLILYPFFLIALTFQNLELTFKLKRAWAYMIAYFSGIIPDITYIGGSQKLPQPSVIVCNHTSYLDIVLAPFYINHLALFMGKAELLKVPLFNIFFKKMDIPVNRTSLLEAHKAFIKAGKEIDKGRSVIIYPEGTIAAIDKLLPFKNGAFKLAIEKQIPIVPIVHLNNRKLLEIGGFFKSKGRPGISKTIVLEPIETIGLKEENLVALRERVYLLIKDTLTEYNGTKN